MTEIRNSVFEQNRLAQSFFTSVSTARILVLNYLMDDKTCRARGLRWSFFFQSAHRKWTVAIVVVAKQSTRRADRSADRPRVNALETRAASELRLTVSKGDKDPSKKTLLGYKYKFIFVVFLKISLE